MDLRRACARVRLTVHTFLSASECTQSRLQYQRQYHSLLDALYKVYRSSSLNPSDPLEAFPGARALLEEYYSEEDTEQPSPEVALDDLLDAAIYCFGYSAHDVFSGVFNHSEMARRHENTFDITYAELQAAVSTRNRSARNPIFHQILALCPVDQGPLVPVRWNVDFKSDWVAKRVIQEVVKQTTPGTKCI